MNERRNALVSAFFLALALAGATIGVARCQRRLIHSTQLTPLRESKSATACVAYCHARNLIGRYELPLYENELGVCSCFENRCIHVDVIQEHPQEPVPVGAP